MNVGSNDPIHDRTQMVQNKSRINPYSAENFCIKHVGQRDFSI